MARTCANCGYVNESANEMAANCPNCGTPYMVPISEPVTYAAPPPPPPNYQAGSGTRVLSKNRKLLLIGLGCVAVLVVLIAGGVVALAASQGHASVAAATATSMATPGRNQQVMLQPYSDPQGQFALKYPSTWQTSTGSATVAGANINLTTFAAMNAKGKAVAGLVVGVGGSGLTLQDAGGIAAQAGLTGFTASGSAPMSITGRGGQTWQSITATATAPDGKPANVVVAFVQHGTSSYLMIGYNSSKAENAAGRRLFAAILKSFTFGSGA